MKSPIDSALFRLGTGAVHLVDAIKQRGRVVTEPRAVATGCYTQPVIDNFTGGRTL